MRKLITIAALASTLAISAPASAGTGDVVGGVIGGLILGEILDNNRDRHDRGRVIIIDDDYPYNHNYRRYKRIPNADVTIIRDGRVYEFDRYGRPEWNPNTPGHSIGCDSRYRGYDRCISDRVKRRIRRGDY